MKQYLRMLREAIRALWGHRKEEGYLFTEEAQVRAMYKI
jgi:hypothetical protein